MNQGWMERQTKDSEARRRYEEERLILRTTESLCQAMADTGMTKADLAEGLGTTRANITQLLSGARNMTLRSLARLSFAVGRRASLDLGELRAGKFIDYPVGGTVRLRKRMTVHVPQNDGGGPSVPAAQGDEVKLAA